MAAHYPKVLVFDSGAGGLSIAETLLQLSPAPLELMYLADDLAFPYGNKSQAFLVNRILELMTSYIAKTKPNIVVIACNTASTLVLPALRARFQLPFVGTVPAIKPAAKLSLSGHIGVLATPGTVEREYTAELIQTFAPHVQVHLYGSDILVQSAESYIASKEFDQRVIDREVNKLLAYPDGKKIDTLVLACTHFPLIAAQIRASAPHILHWVDSGEAVARRCLDLLKLTVHDAPAGTAARQKEKTGQHAIEVHLSSVNTANGSQVSSKENAKAIYEAFLKNDRREQ